MTENPDWPSYPVGSRDSIFAIGVCSIKFVELESILVAMFATTLRISLDTATKIASKVGSVSCLQLTEQVLEKRNDWPEHVKDAVRNFILAVGICMENRNHLAHSNIAHFGDAKHFGDADETVLFKTSKQGNTVMAVPKLAELRRVADDMDNYVHFGRMLSNTINGMFDPFPLFPKNAPFAWTYKPPLPRRLDYTSHLHPLSKDRPAE